MVDALLVVMRKLPFTLNVLTFSLLFHLGFYGSAPLFGPLVTYSWCQDLMCSNINTFSIDFPIFELRIL